MVRECMSFFATYHTTLPKWVAVAEKVNRDFGDGFGAYTERCLDLSVGLPFEKAFAYFGFEAVLSELADFAAQFLDIEAFFAQFGHCLAQFGSHVLQFDVVKYIFVHSGNDGLRVKINVY